MERNRFAKRRMKVSVQDRAVSVVCYLFVLFMVAITFLPFLNVVSKAVSSESMVISGQISFYPKEFQLGTLKAVMGSKVFLNSFKISVLVTVLGSVGSLFITVITAYPLSKKQLPFIKGFLVFFVITMLFSGGMVPTYMLVKGIGLLDSLGALIMPMLLSVYNMLIVKNYYEGLPESLEEAAKIDGAGNIRILLQVILPLSTPVLATIGLFYMVSYWNDYFNALIYISDPSLKPLQLYLREMILQSSQMASQMDFTIDDVMNKSPDGIRSAAVVAVTLPILVVYPFVQKYFVKGITMGSVKG